MDSFKTEKKHYLEIEPMRYFVASILEINKQQQKTNGNDPLKYKFVFGDDTFVLIIALKYNFY